MFLGEFVKLKINIWDSGSLTVGTKNLSIQVFVRMQCSARKFENLIELLNIYIQIIHWMRSRMLLNADYLISATDLTEPIC